MDQSTEYQVSFRCYAFRIYIIHNVKLEPLSLDGAIWICLLCQVWMFRDMLEQTCEWEWIIRLLFAFYVCIELSSFEKKLKVSFS